MTVKELRELLNEAPDDMAVFIPVQSSVAGAFAFEEACSAASGPIVFGPAPDIPGYEPVGIQPGKGFLIAPHSFHDEEVDHTLN